MTTSQTELASRKLRTAVRPYRLAYGLIIMMAFTSTWTGVSVIGSIKATDLALAFATVLGIGAVAGRFSMPPRWLVFAGIVLLLTLALSTLFPADPSYMAGRYRQEIQGTSSAIRDLQVTNSPTVAALQWFVGLAIVPVIVSNIIVKARRSAVAVAWAFALGAGVSAMFGILDYIGVTSIGPNLTGFEGQDRISGLASHVNNFGFAAALAAPIALHMARTRRVGGTVLFLLLATAAVLSGSRGAQVGILLVLVLVLMFDPRHRTSRLLASIYAGLWLVTLAVLFLSSLSSTLGSFLRFGADAGASESDQGRLRLMEQGLADWAHSPFFGLGYSVLTGAHSIYIQILAAGGLLLAAGLIYYFFGLFRDLLRLRRAGDELAPYLAVLFCAWLSCGVIENVLVERYLYIPVGLVIAMTSLLLESRSLRATNRDG